MTDPNGSVIEGTWEKDRLNGQGTITRKGKSSVEVIFKEDIIIQQKSQFGCCDWFYFITCVFLMLVFYVGIPVGLITEQTPAFGGVGFVWIVYIISSCCTNSTKYICNTVDLVQTFKNIDMAIAARPIC